MKKIVMLVLVIAVIFAATSCTNDVSDKTLNEGETNKLKIYTSFYPMYFITKEIVKDKAEVINMVPAGVEPHDWEPTLKTMAELQKSDLFIYNGAGMERWADRVIGNLDKNKTLVVEASKGIELIGSEDGHEDDDHGDYDPHVWVSPVNLKKEALNVLNALIEKDKENEEFYKDNYEKLAASLMKLDADIRDAVKNFKSNIIVTSHEAFGYFAKEYGLTQIPIRGVSPQQEPTLKELEEIINLCKDNDVKFIFVEKFVSPKYSKIVAEGIGGEVLTLNAAHGLTDEEEKAGKDYISIMYENLENLKKALE